MRSPEDHIQTLWPSLCSLIGKKLISYACYNYAAPGEQPRRWDDLPLELMFEGGAVLAVAWSELDDLWIGAGDTLPFDAGTEAVRAISSGIPGLETIIGKELGSVFVGKGEFSVEGHDVEIHTRLLFSFGEDAWLEVYNALDENGYSISTTKPDGQWVRAQQLGSSEPLTRPAGR